MSLLQASKVYKPFEYPWAYEYWKRQQQVHWMPEEVPLGEDCRDWAEGFVALANRDGDAPVEHASYFTFSLW